MAVAYASSVTGQSFSASNFTTGEFTLNSGLSGNALIVFLAMPNATSCVSLEIVGGSQFTRFGQQSGVSTAIEIWGLQGGCILSNSIAVHGHLSGLYGGGWDVCKVLHYTGVSGWMASAVVNSGADATNVSTAVAGFSTGVIIDYCLTRENYRGVPLAGQTERWDTYYGGTNNHWISDRDAEDPTTMGWSCSAAISWIHLAANLLEMAVPVGVVIDDPTSPSVADDAAIQLAHDIPTIEDTVSLSALGEPTPYEGTDAYADDGLSASSTDEITLSVAATLEVAEATSVSLADAPAVDGAINMAVDDSASASTADDPGSITQSLLLNDAMSGSSADEAAVSRVDLYSINATLPQLETTEDLLYDQYGNPFYQTSFVGNKVMRGTLPTFTATVLSGFAGIIGQIPSTVKLPALRVSTISGSSTYSNAVSAELPAFSVSSLWANRGDMSSIAKTLGGLYGAITAKVGIVGSIADTLPDLRVG